MTRCKDWLKFFLVSWIGTAAACACAQGVRVITEEFPPYNYTEAGKVTGFSTDVVRAVMQEAKLQADIQSLPWARAYSMAQTDANVLIYSIGRSAQREKLFKWVGVIAPTQYYLYSLPQRGLKFQHLDEAKAYQIATVNEDVGEQYLIAKGFSKGRNLQSSVKYELNYEKYKRGRVDLWIMPELTAFYLARQAGDNPADTLARSLAIPDLGGEGYYMAFSPNTSDELVERIRKALHTIKRNGTFDTLKKKWL